MKIVKKIRTMWNRFGENRRRRIRSIAKRHSDANTRMRAQIVLALVGGKTAVEIVGVLQCSPSLIYKVAERFLEFQEGAFVDRREDNGTRVVDRLVVACIGAMVGESPREFGQRRPTWTLALLCLVMKRTMGIEVSRATLCRHLRRWKIGLRRPKPFVECPWPAARRDERLRRIRYLLLHAREGDVWVFEDEVDIHLNPKIGPD